MVFDVDKLKEAVAEAKDELDPDTFLTPAWSLVLAAAVGKDDK